MPSPGRPGTPPPDMPIALYTAQPGEPPSQLERIERAEDGDLNARLDLMSTEEVERALSKARRPDRPDEHILDYLNNPGNGKTQADALKETLDSLADKTEEIAITSAFVWRYARANRLWTTHRNPLMRTETAFLNNLEQNSLVQINIIAGTSAYAVRASCIRTIEEQWGVDWFQRVPQCIRPPVDRPIALSRRMLVLITASCKSGVGLDEAIAAWEKSVRMRTDVGLRREKRSRLPFAKHIVSSDIEALVRSDQEEEYGRRVVEAHLPGLKEDRLRLQSLRHEAEPRNPAPKPKRRRSGATLARSKRVKAGPAAASDGADDSGDDDGATTDARGDEGPARAMGSPTSVRDAECDGPALRAALSELVGALDEWKGMDRYCRSCEPLATEVMARVRGLRGAIAMLVEVREHSFYNPTASSRDPHDTPPQGRARVGRRSIVVDDTSDEE